MIVAVASAVRVRADSPGFSTARRDRHPPEKRQDDGMAWDQKRRTPADYINPHKAARIIAAHGGICWLCGHEGGVLDVDHIIPWAEWTHPDLSVHDASNLAPAHRTPCPTCGLDCHAIKSKDEATRGRARSNAIRAARGKRPAEKHPGLI